MLTISLCSVFTTTGNTAEDITYAAEYCRAGCKRCGVYLTRAFNQHPTWHFSVGVYSTGPLWGRIVDSRGSRIPLACSFVFLLGGYSGIRYFYDSGLAPDAFSFPMISFCVLVLCSFLTGAGGSGGCASAVNSTAKTFPDQVVCMHWRFSKVGFPHHSMSASIHNRSCNIWFWTIGFPLLDYLPYILRW